MHNPTSYKPTNWMLTAKSTKDLGPDANIDDYTGIPDDEQCISLNSTGTIHASTVRILLCFDTSKSKWTSRIGCDIYLRGFTDFENVLRAVGTVANIDNIWCSLDEGFNTSKFGASRVNADNDRYTYWNVPNKLPCQYSGWALFTGSAGQQNAPRHCNPMERDLLASLSLCGTFLSDTNQLICSAVENAEYSFEEGFNTSNFGAS